MKDAKKAFFTSNAYYSSTAFCLDLVKNSIYKLLQVMQQDRRGPMLNMDAELQLQVID